MADLGIMPGFGRNSLACVGGSVNCLKSKKQLKMPRFYGLQNKLGIFSAIETSTRTLHINKEFKNDDGYGYGNAKNQ